MVQSIDHELTELVDVLAPPAAPIGQMRVALRGEPDQLAESGTDGQSSQRLEIDQDTNHAVSAAAQTVGIAGSGRLLTGAEQSDQRVELFGERHRGPADRRRAQL